MFDADRTGVTSVLEPDLQGFLDAVDEIAEMSMVQSVAPFAIRILQEKINSEVYAVDWPGRKYKRKYYNHGLIDPREIEWQYESQTNTLIVRSIRDDWEPTMRAHEGRNVAEVVETGNGYDWFAVRPRPFHKPAEEFLITSGEVDALLTRDMQYYLALWSW